MPGLRNSSDQALLEPLQPSSDAESPTSGERWDEETIVEPEPLLCRHCLRTASNGIKCQGICVADSNY